MANRARVLIELTEQLMRKINGKIKNKESIGLKCKTAEADTTLEIRNEKGYDTLDPELTDSEKDIIIRLLTIYFSDNGDKKVLVSHHVTEPLIRVDFN